MYKLLIKVWMVRPMKKVKVGLNAKHKLDDQIIAFWVGYIPKLRNTQAGL